MTPQQYADYLARQAKPTKREVAADKYMTDVLASVESCESKLHDRIVMHCRYSNWIPLHSRMDERTGRFLGEPDFTILADSGRLFFIECKSAKGKLSMQQQALHAWAAKLGHKVHVVRTFAEFLEVVR